MIEWSKIEEKWRRRWDEAKIYESNPDDSKPKFFLTVAYPYPNSPQHIGHGRTYTLADVHARYMRMKGYNTLLPMGFHYTGTPILAMARRISEGDKDLIDTFRNIYHVPDEAIKTFDQPLNIAIYFHKDLKMGMREMGYSIDWRREFTTIDSEYNRFIEWQFRKLKEKGLISQGTHPVGWCPKDNNPVGQHDTLGDVEPEIGEYVLMKFLIGDDILPAATLRPETIFGVTNIWVNPEGTYVKAKVNNESWIISIEAAGKLHHLGKNVLERERISGRELIGKLVKNPYDGREIHILPASFVSLKSGTGIVMSVPAHAPYDYQALVDLKNDLETLSNYGLEGVVGKIRPIPIISCEGYSEVPARDILEMHTIKSQADPKLEDATKELYSKEFHMGVMKDNAQGYAGLPVSRARDQVREDGLRKDNADLMHDILNGPVLCRCGAECVVRTLKDQWFINYGDDSWKNLSRECLSQMTITPEDVREEFQYTIGWLRERACARQSGMGTKLPWDKDWIIESLSDSVIYMAFYLLKRIIVNEGIGADKLTDSVFDYALQGLGNIKEISNETGISVNALEAMQREFEFFYPVDSRHSGRDLVPNHLTFYVMNHSALFPEAKWPIQVVVNGSVLMEGKKMSKSFGNIIPLRDAVRMYGADPLRLAILGSAELLQDADFGSDLVHTFKERLLRLYNEAKALADGKDFGEGVPLPSNCDKWLLSTVQRTIENCTEAMDKLRAREAIHHAVYLLDQALSWYAKRIFIPGSDKTGILKDVLRVRVKLIAPFAPFMAEEIWEIMGGNGFVSLSSWPSPNKALIDPKAEAVEELIQRTLEDAQEIIKVTGIKPKRTIFYLASKWKWKAYLKALGLKDKLDMKLVMQALLEDPELKSRAKELYEFVKKIMEEIVSQEIVRGREELGEINELWAFAEAKQFFSRELNSEIDVYDESDDKKYDPAKRSGRARPYKPAIYVE